MKNYINVSTQAEADKAIAAGDWPRITGAGWIEIRQGYAEAYGSATVTAYGSATVTAYGSATVRAYGSATVTAYDSATVTASDSATVTASDSATVTASNYVSVVIHGKTVKVKGGYVLRIPPIKTAKQWCEFYGVTVRAGKAIVFKALNADFTSPKGGNYTPGSEVTPDGWDKDIECGKGLHFSPRPFMALRFHDTAVKFVACSVALKDIVIHPNGSYPEKCKAPKCRALYECDLDGNQITAA